MKKLKILTILAVTILISGCSQKVEPEKIYIEPKAFEFQKLDFTGVYIELQENENICIRPLKELNAIYKESKQFYDEQIDDYFNSFNQNEIPSKK